MNDFNPANNRAAEKDINGELGLSACDVTAIKIVIWWQLLRSITTTAVKWSEQPQPGHLTSQPHRPLVEYMKIIIFQHCGSNNVCCFGDET